MEAITKKGYAVYSTDDRGYSQGFPLAVYPFKAAAAYSKEYKNCHGYADIREVSIVCFEDICYICDGSVKNDCCYGKFRLGLVETVYSLKKRGETYYLNGDDILLEEIRKAESEVCINKNIYLIRDSKITYILKFPSPVIIQSFALSRELAVANAMDKLTEEEKKLLGLK